MFYEKIALLCAKKGVSVSTMCKEVGLASSAPARWKKGSTPNATTVYRIAEYFGVEADYLMDEMYKGYTEWLNEKMHMSEAVRIQTKWRIEEAREVEPQAYETLLPLIKQLTPAQVQRVKDFISGILS